MVIYKIFRDAEYRDFQTRGETAGAPIDVTDGYIHFSTADQVVETAAKHFAGEDNLWLLTVEADTLDPLRWEPSRGGALFPHLYRSLMAADILSAHALSRTDAGHDFTGLL